MELIEWYTEARGPRDVNEDAVVITPAHVAVIDGATDIGDRRYRGLTPGRFAMETLKEAITTLPPEATADEAIDALSGVLKAAATAAGMKPDAHIRPTATVACFSIARSELWRVGDACVRVGGFWSVPKTELDVLASSARAAYDRAMLALGMPLAEIEVHDPGREIVLPILHLQTRFQNDPADFAEFGRGVIDGRSVPARFREIWRVTPGTEVVLATDGYPSPAPTLAQAEAELADLLARDPQRIDKARPGTKGRRPGNTSYDDRAYIRLRA
ncbi:MAG: hypothetical protein U0869_22205 [Chloroflexota bacterium]